MIQSNELRIGNWVKSPKCLVDLDCKTNEFNNLVYTQVKYVRHENYFEPIPLTPEILEKAGFSRLGGMLIYYNFKITFLMDTGGRYVIDIFYKDLHLGKIEWIHQLQNLYWCLSGEELIISLTSGST